VLVFITRGQRQKVRCLRSDEGLQRRNCKEEDKLSRSSFSSVSKDKSGAISWAVERERVVLAREGLGVGGLLNIVDRLIESLGRQSCANPVFNSKFGRLLFLAARHGS